MEYVSIIILSLIALAVLITVYVFIKSRSLKISQKDNKYIKKQWDKVLSYVNKSPNQSLLEADKLLSYTFKIKGYHGSVGEQLKKYGHNFTDLDGIWSAHKLRNRIAHEMDVKLSPKQVRKAIKQFKSAIEDLGAKL